MPTNRSKQAATVAEAEANKPASVADSINMKPTNPGESSPGSTEEREVTVPAQHNPTNPNVKLTIINR